MPTPRKQQVCLQATPYYHCISRCVRRAYLCGKDKVTNISYDHRRGWIEERLLYLSQAFCIDVCAYAVMSNHCHVVLHVDIDKARDMSDLDVLNCWHQVCRGTMVTRKYALEGKVEEHLESTLKETISVYRNRLSDISWFMRLLNEPIARMANAEDECTGRFWEGRFTSQALLDDSALAACMAYVDLNPIRAAGAKSPETSEYTSIKRRIAAAETGKQPKSLMSFVGNPRRDMPKGLPFLFKDYAELVDLTGRVIRDNVSGYIDCNLPDILSRLNISPKNWIRLTTGFEQHFKGVVGQISSLTEFCEMQNRTRRPNFFNCQQLFK
ncbi:transposase [Thalassotalea litorea]|uniref:Transposase n=1 Tax=Thalassotalea litorea TaxID=2020715 RepID=A0A5R9IHP2_9GAMM|nr:transposase [Thalassotalea litorea]TLU64812.1 transposase [Thalassotalea litorea]